jgi:LysR family transcriptional regulator, transcriptional activator for bauABCD operon
MKVSTHAGLGQISDMDMRLLRVFKAVADCGGMAAAELELNIGTSTVSRHIKDLETRLGLTLCRRGRGGFALTEEGEKIYQQTLTLLAATDSFRSGVDEIHRRLGGELTVALFDKTASNPDAHIHEAIAKFCALAPGVSINLHVAPINAVEQGLMNGQFQVGVIPGHRESASFEYRRLFGEHMALYCGAQHALFKRPTSLRSWDDVGQYPFAGLGYHSPNMALSLAKRLPRRATAFDQEGIATLILSGHFIGFLPTHYAAAFEVQGLMRPINSSVLNYRCDFFSIYRRTPQPARATRLFLDCLNEAHP